MGQTSEFTEVVRELAREGAKLREQAAKARPVPFMREKLSRRDALNRVGRMTPQDLAEMTPEERQGLIKEVGTDAVLGIIRRSR